MDHQPQSVNVAVVQAAPVLMNKDATVKKTVQLIQEAWQCTMRHIALEGRCYVMSCNQYVEKNMVPTDLNGYDELESQPDIMCSGGSAIIDPFGNYVAGPIFGEEKILYADLDLGAITRSRLDFDVCGHYSRPDVFELLIK